MRFLTDPLYKRAPKGRLVLASPLFIAVAGAVQIVPAGFETDGASIPLLCWPLVGHPFSPSHLRAATAHDWHCRYPKEHGWSSATVHDCFRAALLEEGVHPIRATAMWLAVRLFGPRFPASVDGRAPLA